MPYLNKENSTSVLVGYLALLDFLLFQELKILIKVI